MSVFEETVAPFDGVFHFAAPSAADTFAGSRIVGTGADGKAITASEYAKLSEGANLGTGIIETGGMTADLVPAVTSAPIKGPIPFNQVVQGGSSGLTGLAKAKNLALTGLEKGSKFITKNMAGDFMDKAKVLSIPAATATGDLTSRSKTIRKTSSYRCCVS